ncbi:MAG TPA: hypothetical protein PKL77_06005 [Candidatus Omnitrophota bacterium]|nr:hypothetical protein [Candidatus Omnitrophota bacterium]
MIFIYCVKDDYPEQLCTLTFAYFSIEAVVSAGIKVFEVLSNKKPKEEEEADYNFIHTGEDK